jgi:hypothetical protein
MHKLEFELLRIEQIKATIEQVQARIEQVQSRIEQVRKGGLPPQEPNSNRDFILASAGVNHPSLLVRFSMEPLSTARFLQHDGG